MTLPISNLSHISSIANSYLQDTAGNTLVHNAVLSQNVEVLKNLLAQPEYQNTIHMLNNQGASALDLAIKQNFRMGIDLIQKASIIKTKKYSPYANLNIERYNVASIHPSLRSHIKNYGSEEVFRRPIREI